MLSLSRPLSCHAKAIIIPICKLCGKTQLSIRKQILISSNSGYRKCHLRHLCSKLKVLGIETSCDDTGSAVVDSSGVILGEALHSQVKTSVELGGILPEIARDLHKKHIEGIVNESLEKAQLSIKDIDAIAVTVKPGMAMSLKIGLAYAKELVQKSGKPMIPVHHMEAHALTVRMLEKVDFPFLVLLISGGHCLLAVAKSVDDFVLIGKGLDCSPGEVFDKAARRLKIKNLPQCEGLSGGASIELLAKDGDHKAFLFPSSMTTVRDCNFAVSGLRLKAEHIAENEEIRQDIRGGNVLPNVADICASFQYGMLKHLARRLHIAFLFCELKGLLPEKDKVLVISGGVASNMYLRQGLEKICDRFDCRMICPPPHLCTDNGIMIAWNGMEKLLIGKGIVEDFESVQIQPKCPLGEDISDEVQKCHIKFRKIRL